MKKKLRTPTVFFNASVILSGFHSTSGGSAKLLRWVKHGKIKGVISEVILDEVTRRAGKIRLSEEKARSQISLIFSAILPAPTASNVNKYSEFVIDQGDGHVLASSHEAKAKYLVTLDKKHLLILQEKIKQ